MATDYNARYKAACAILELVDDNSEEWPYVARFEIDNVHGLTVRSHLDPRGVLMLGKTYRMWTSYEDGSFCQVTEMCRQDVLRALESWLGRSADVAEVCS